MTRVLAVDPGEARIGLAVSDPSRTVARPLTVIPHTSRSQDADEIIEAAHREAADTIVVGVAYDADGLPGPQARRALRLVDAVRAAGFTHVETWDETGSTRAASRLGRGKSDLDAQAAAVILQDYLNASKQA